jgi:hypothetical protein
MIPNVFRSARSFSRAIALLILIHWWHFDACAYPMLQVVASGNSGTAASHNGAAGGQVVVVLNATLSFPDADSWPVLSGPVQLGDGEFHYRKILPTASIRIGGQNVTILCGGDFEPSLVTNVTSTAQMTPKLAVYCGGRVGNVNVNLSGRTNTSGASLPGGRFEFYGRAMPDLAVTVAANGGGAYGLPSASPGLAGTGGSISVVGPDESLSSVFCCADGGDGGITAGTGSGSAGGHGGTNCITANSWSIQAQANGGDGAAGTSSANGGIGGRGGDGGCIKLAVGPIWSMTTAAAGGGNGGPGGGTMALGAVGGAGGDGGAVAGLSPDQIFATAAVGGGCGGNGGYGYTRGGNGGRGGNSSSQPGSGGLGGPTGIGGTVGTPGANGVIAAVAACQCQPVLVFIPGIAGSELSDGAQTLWPSINPNTISRLALTPGGISAPGVIVEDIIRRTGPMVLGFGDVPIYEGIMQFFAGQGYVEYNTRGRPDLRSFAGMFAQLKPVVDASGNLPTLFAFPYDWRLSNADSASKLRKFVDGVKWLYPGARLISWRIAWEDWWCVVSFWTRQFPTLPPMWGVWRPLGRRCWAHLVPFIGNWQESFSKSACLTC